MTSFKLSFMGLFSNYALIAGFVLYAIGAAMLIIALRGGELSVLYPFIALSFVWVALISRFFFHEPMNVFKLTGIGFIMLGIACIGKGSD